MIKHFITKYEESVVRYAEAWIQINALGKTWCLCKRKIRI